MVCGTNKVANDGVETQKHKQNSLNISDKTSATYLVNSVKYVLKQIELYKDSLIRHCQLQPLWVSAVS